MENHTSLKWFQRIVWAGILINLVFILPALCNPRWLLHNFGMAYYNPEWLQNAAMLLISLGFFYLPAALNPLRFTVSAWLAVLSRLIAVIFWIWLLGHTNHAAAIRPMLYTDLAMFLLLGTTLQIGLPAADKMSLAKVGQLFAALNPLPFLRRVFRTTRAKIVGLSVLAAVLTLGFTAWNNLVRERPIPSYPDDEEQYKYGVIGLGMSARVPFYVFEVLPELFPEKFPVTGGYADYGLITEEGQEVPIGFAKRQVGFISVEPNCALCHTGGYRKSPDSPLQPIPGAPAHMLDLEGFQWMLYDAAADAKFTVDNFMTAIEKRHELGFVERQYYRYFILPSTKKALLAQGKAYAWQKSRPKQGRGRTDTFNPTKFNVMDFPWDSTVGTVDLPQVWNQKPREKLHLHWDGNNNDLTERNYAAAMAVGATPSSVIPANFKRVTDYLLTLQPIPYPFSIDAPKAARGELIYQQQCASCHAFGQAKTGQVTPIEEIGTDPHRLFSFTEQLVEEFHSFNQAPFVFQSYTKTYGYANTPLDGVWARAPYLHNGAVPTLWDLLQPPALRPKTFFKGYEVYDSVQVGFVTSGPGAERVGTLIDVKVVGNSNEGHLYGVTLSDSMKWDLIEYMKKL